MQCKGEDTVTWSLINSNPENEHFIKAINQSKILKFQIRSVIKMYLKLGNEQVSKIIQSENLNETLILRLHIFVAANKI